MHILTMNTLPCWLASLLATSLLACSDPATQEAPQEDMSPDDATRDMTPKTSEDMSEAPPDMEGASTSPPPAPSAGCGQTTTSLRPGERVLITQERDGQERSWFVRLPSDYEDDEPLPLLFVLHGGFGTAERTIEITRFDALADQERVILVYPNGYAQFPRMDGALRIQTWNAGGCCGASQSEDIDDVAFLLDVLAQTQAQACVDRRRVFMSGMSNGAMMSYRMACEAGEYFAAIAPVAGSMVIDTCEPKKAPALLHIHGMRDDHVPFTGGAGCGPGDLEASKAIEDVMSIWSDLHGCDQTRQVLSEREDSTCVQQEGCEAKVRLCTLDEGGHVWPGGPKEERGSVGECSDDRGYVDTFDASARIMDFVLAHALEELPR